MLLLSLDEKKYTLEASGGLQNKPQDLCVGPELIVAAFNCHNNTPLDLVCFKYYITDLRWPKRVTHTTVAINKAEVLKITKFGLLIYG